MNWKGSALAFVALILAETHGNTAHADSQSGTPTVLASVSELLNESGSTTTALAISGPGQLFLTVTDLEFPTSFASLQYGVSDAIGTILPMTAADTTTQFNVTAPTTLYANVFATVGSSGAGLYNLTATFVSAVPLPGTLLLLTSGGVMLVLRGRRRSISGLAA